MKCRLMRQFIWVLTVYKSTHLAESRIQRVKKKTNIYMKIWCQYYFGTQKYYKNMENFQLVSDMARGSNMMDKTVLHIHLTKR